jgi:hypothetical protein
MKTDIETADSKGPAGAPAKEIEVTPEMVDAALWAMRDYSWDDDDSSEVLSVIFRAMLRNYLVYRPCPTAEN